MPAHKQLADRRSRRRGAVLSLGRSGGVCTGAGLRGGDGSRGWQVLLNHHGTLFPVLNVIAPAQAEQEPRPVRSVGPLTTRGAVRAGQRVLNSDCERYREAFLEIVASQADAPPS